MEKANRIGMHDLLSLYRCIVVVVVMVSKGRLSILLCNLKYEIELQSLISISIITLWKRCGKLTMSKIFELRRRIFRSNFVTFFFI